MLFCSSFPAVHDQTHIDHAGVDYMYRKTKSDRKETAIHTK